MKTKILVLVCVVLLAACGWLIGKNLQLSNSLKETQPIQSTNELTRIPKKLSEKLKHPPGAAPYGDDKKIELSGNYTEITYTSICAKNGPPTVGSFMSTMAMNIEKMPFESNRPSLKDDKLAYLGHFYASQIVDIIPGAIARRCFGLPGSYMSGLPYALYMFSYPGGHLALCVGYLENPNNVFITIISLNRDDRTMRTILNPSINDRIGRMADR